MKTLKGTILEIIVERLLTSCGFRSVSPDGIYVHKEGDGLQWVHGKGAQHDADVLLEPPYQSPLGFPTRIIIECKSYKITSKVTMSIVRNAFGLRTDVNDFEIVTLDHLQDRQNMKRRVLAVENRKRYLYQVGVCSISGFTKPAMELALNQKIPLLDLEKAMPGINQMIRDVNQISDDEQKELLRVVRDGLYTNRDLPPQLNRIAEELERQQDSFVVGTMETGDVLFLRVDPRKKTLLRSMTKYNGMDMLQCSIHYYSDDEEKWFIHLSFNGEDIHLEFLLPDGILKMWTKEGRSPESALNLKERFMSNFSITTSHPEGSLISLNLHVPNLWFDACREALNNPSC